MSMGFLVPQDAPIAWRGLMVQKAMNQLLFEVAWPKLDLLVLDLPPGTGDVQLTITQSVLLDGAIVVSTPQDLALRDAVRGVEFFDKTKTKVLGMVQNMSTFTCTNCGHHQDVFGFDGRFSSWLSMLGWLRNSCPFIADFICYFSLQAQRRSAKSSASLYWETSRCTHRSAPMQTPANRQLSEAQPHLRRKLLHSFHET
jgi:hypothetical protein